MATLLARYSAAMARQPLRTNLCTAVPLMVVGDVCAQQLESRQRGHTAGTQLASVDPQRTLVMTSYSAGIFTPIFFYLYPVLDKYLRGPPLALALQKGFGSILIGGVPANIAFLALATTVEMKVFNKVPASGASLSEVVQEKWRDDFPRIMIGSLSFWGPVNCCNFYWTPPQYRILTISVSAVAWNCYLSVVQHEYVHGPTKA
jgi:hypothetical protein